MHEPARVLLTMIVVAVTAAAPARAGSGGCGPPPPPTGSTTIVVDVDRVWIVERLIELGRDPAEAWRQAMLLTDADVAVLAAHPRMVQSGGARLSSSLIIGLLLIAGLVALAYAGDGFIMIN